MNKAKVLFLCTGNSARSQMGEAWLRHYGSQRFEAYSAGLSPKGIHSCTEQVMAEVGISLAGHSSKDVTVYLGHQNFGYLITVCDHAEKNCPTTFVGISQRLHWSFEDPAAFEGDEAAQLDKFRQVRDTIGARVQAWVAEQSA